MNEKFSSNEKLKTIQRLLSLKNDFSDSIPSTVIHSNNPNNKFKVRRNWFQALTANLENAVNAGEIKNEQLKKEITRFVDYAVSDTFHGKPLTEKKDIDWANKIIDMVVAELSR